MIGVFDSGSGGLTILRDLTRRLPTVRFVYLGDHINAPYGLRPSEDIVALAKAGVETLFAQGCRLVIVACNTVVCVALRHLQQDWLDTLAPDPGGPRNVLGIVAPTVEAATGMRWSDDERIPTTAPRTPYSIGVFATPRTVEARVYEKEIQKRRPDIRVFEQAIPGLAGAIEAGTPYGEMRRQIEAAVAALEGQANGIPDRIILGCTHFPLVEHLFREVLPASVPIFEQGPAVAIALADYLARHPHFLDPPAQPVLLSTAPRERIPTLIGQYWPGLPQFAQLTVEEPEPIKRYGTSL